MNTLLIAATGGNPTVTATLQAALEKFLAGYGKVLESDEPYTSSAHLMVWIGITEFEPDVNHQGKLGHTLSMLPAPAKVFVSRIGEEREESDMWILRQTSVGPFLEVTRRDGDIFYQEMYTDLPFQV